MPKPISWSVEMDSQIIAMRGNGQSWDSIASTLGVARYTVACHGRSIGAAMPNNSNEADDTREPLAAGHAFTWSLLTKGTALDGVSYPAHQPPRFGRASQREAA
jgi:hypothetical protein